MQSFVETTPFDNLLFDRFHLGSIAFGSLIIAIIRVIRYVISSVDKKLRKFDNPPVRYLLKYVQGEWWWLQNLKCHNLTYLAANREDRTFLVGALAAVVGAWNASFGTLTATPTSW